MNLGDTIAAVSSAAGPAARMIVRVSGPLAARCVADLAGEAAPTRPIALHTRISFADLEVPAWIFFFRHPHSYTGDDLAEFHLPGHPILADLLLKRLLAAGARLAEAGEFTARAYFSGRLDLAQAEGVAATIAAGNEAELHAAQRLLAGELSRRLAPMMESLADGLARVEADIDFADEDIPTAAREELNNRLTSLRVELVDLLSKSARFEPLTHEPRVVLVGRPNAGKSTLLNALLGRERAVTSPLAGTTRDALSADLDLPRGRVSLVDVAGLDDTPQSPLAEVDDKMRRHAWRAAETADLLALVVDSSDPREPLMLPRTPELVIHTKADLLSCAQPLHSSLDRSMQVSAFSGFQLGALRNRLDQMIFGDSARGESLALNSRHIRQIENSIASLDRALAETDLPLEVLALELRDALDELGGVLRQITPDDVLGKVFSSFCIGK